MFVCSVCAVNFTSYHEAKRFQYHVSVSCTVIRVYPSIYPCAIASAMCRRISWRSKNTFAYILCTFLRIPGNFLLTVFWYKHTVWHNKNKKKVERWKEMSSKLFIYKSVPCTSQHTTQSTLLQPELRMQANFTRLKQIDEL